MRTWGIVILLASACGAIQAPPQAWAEPPNAVAAQPSDREIAELIDRAETQVADGHVWEPAGDNALETVQLILSLLPTATPEGRAEIDAMPHRLRQRAAIEDAAGHSVEARRFMLFAEAVAPGGAEHTGATRPGPDPKKEPSPEAGTAAAAPSPAPPEGRGPPAERPPVAPIAEAPTQAGPSASASPREADPPSAEVVASLVPGTVAPPAPAPGAGPAPDSARPATAQQQATAVPGPPLGAEAPPAPPAAEALPPAVIAALIRRGDAMLALGDISAARLLYERAARAGSGEAAADVGRTHDPAVLAQLGARGMQPDPDMAATWYRRAIALGDAASAERLQRLEANRTR
jgi:hypothetical protein